MRITDELLAELKRDETCGCLMCTIVDDLLELRAAVRELAQAEASGIDAAVLLAGKKVTEG